MSADFQETQWFPSLNFGSYNTMKSLFQNTKSITQGKEKKIVLRENWDT